MYSKFDTTIFFLLWNVKIEQKLNYRNTSIIFKTRLLFIKQNWSYCKKTFEWKLYLFIYLYKCTILNYNSLISFSECVSYTDTLQGWGPWVITLIRICFSSYWFKFSPSADVCYSICLLTPLQIWNYIFQRIMIQSLKNLHLNLFIWFQTTQYPEAIHWKLLTFEYQGFPICETDCK